MVGAMGSCDDEMSCCESTVPVEEESEHDCMDLCLCSCCGNSVFFDIKDDIAIATISFVSSHQAGFIYQSQFSKIFYADIWQPPKLG